MAFNQRRLSAKEDGERSLMAIITCVVDNGPLIKRIELASLNEDVT